MRCIYRFLPTMANQATQRFQQRLIRRMLLLPLLDLGIAGIYIFVTGRVNVLPVILANLALFGLATCCFSVWAYRPVRLFEATGTGNDEAARRIERLPALSALAAGLLVVLFSITASSLGVYTPPQADLSRLSQQEIGLALVFYASMYAALYGFFAYFAVNDLCISMRRYWRDALQFSSHQVPSGAWQASSPWRGLLARRLAAIFVVIGVLPSLLIGMDLSILAPIRSLQGLSVPNVIALDLLATLYVVLASVYFVSRSVLVPARELFAAQDAVRRGDLDHHAAVLTNDELGEVAARFNVMVGSLRERELMKDALHRYLSPTVANELIASGGVIAARSVDATVMFTDIEAFTSLSETLSPQETADLLSAYFSTVTALIHEVGGTVNNFVGDAVVAVFNVPVRLDDHAHAAVRAAVAIQSTLASKTFTMPGGREISLPTRIGINTGPVCAGSIGSSQRQGYTMYGDAVNLAARIEPVNKLFGTRILVSAATRDTALLQGFPDRFVRRDTVTVAGRKEPVALYSLDA